MRAVGLDDEHVQRSALRPWLRLLVAQVVLVAHTLPWVACTMRARGVSAEVRGTREAALTTGQGPRRTMSNTSAVS